MLWEELLNQSENEQYTESDFKKEIEKLNLSERDSSFILGRKDEEEIKKLKAQEFKEKITDLKFVKAMTEVEILEFIESTNIEIENKNHKFPQANSIIIAIYTLNMIINEDKFRINPPSASDLADLYGYTDRQGNYYGDLLVYMGFLKKENSLYLPTELAVHYKSSNEEKRVKLLIKSFLKHKTLRNYYLLKKNLDTLSPTNDNLLKLISNDPLMGDFKKSTIQRRKSTVEAIIKWVDSVTIPSPKPFLKWAGGKQRLVKKLKERIPKEDEYSTYIEPFAGGAAMLYNVPFKNAIVNDLNEELINTYNQIKTNVDSVYNIMNGFKNESDDFYHIRNLDRDVDFKSTYSKAYRAARFIYLNKTCFNGLYRVNKQGHFNTPFGKYKNSSYKDKEMITIVSNFFNQNNISFISTDFAEVLNQADNNSFVYLDPPYDPISKTSSFTSYTDLGFSREDQRRLKNICDRLTEKGVKIMISNNNTPFIQELYKTDSKYNYEIIEVQRNISALPESRGMVEEVIITNYDLK